MYLFYIYIDFLRFCTNAFLTVLRPSFWHCCFLVVQFLWPCTNKHHSNFVLFPYRHCKWCVLVELSYKCLKFPTVLVTSCIFCMKCIFFIILERFVSLWQSLWHKLICGCVVHMLAKFVAVLTICWSSAKWLYNILYKLYFMSFHTEKRMWPISKPFVDWKRVGKNL